MVRLTKASVLALKSYVALPGSLQGSIRKTPGEAQIMQFSTSAKSSFRDLVAQGQTDDGLICVERMRVYDAGDLTKPPRIKTGPYVLRGIRVRQSGSENLATVQVLEGNLTGTWLVAWSASDLKECVEPRPLAFGTQTALQPLVPVFSYVEALLRGTLREAIVVCANGIFFLKAPEATNPGTDLGAAEKLIHNLISDVSYVARSGEENVETIYRLSKNAILLASGKSLDKVQKIQRFLGGASAGGFRSAEGSSHFMISESISSLDGESPDLETIQNATRDFFPRAQVTEETLVKWQRPAVICNYTVSLEPNHGDSHEIGFLLEDVGVHIKVISPPLRENRPGERLGLPREQLDRIIEDIVRELHPKVRTPAQVVFDSAVLQIAELFQKQISAAGVFSFPVEVHLSASQEVAEGPLASTSSGNSVVVPKYALASSSPRLAAYMGGLLTLGVRSSFMPWSMTESGLMLG